MQAAPEEQCMLLVFESTRPRSDHVAELGATFAGDQIRFQRPIDFEVHGRAGMPLTVIANDRDGHVVKIESSLRLTPADVLERFQEGYR